jgi:hypothetical protein
MARKFWRKFKIHRNGFKTFNQVQSPPLKAGGIKRRNQGFKHRNIFNISSIESLGPTQELGLRAGFETTSKI